SCAVSARSPAPDPASPMIFVVPTEMAVARPLASTDATDGFVERQFGVRFPIRSLRPFLICAEYWSVSVGALSTSLVWFNVTDAGALVTMTVTESRLDG